MVTLLLANCRRFAAESETRRGPGFCGGILNYLDPDVGPRPAQKIGVIFRCSLRQTAKKQFDPLLRPPRRCKGGRLKKDHGGKRQDQAPEQLYAVVALWDHHLFQPKASETPTATLTFAPSRVVGWVPATRVSETTPRSRQHALQYRVAADEMIERRTDVQTFEGVWRAGRYGRSEDRFREARA